MHKDEASKLFGVLSNPTRVKMLKVLYNNESISLAKFAEICAVEQTVASWHLAMLVESGMMQMQDVNGEAIFTCNRALVDELMSFVSTRCNCCNLG